MFSGVENIAQIDDGSTDSIELKDNQEQEMDTRENTSSKVKQQSGSAKTKVATEPILMQV